MFSDTTTISHIVLTPSSLWTTDFSFFQGISKSIIESDEYLSIFSALAYFPHDIAEIFKKGTDFVALKLAGSSLDINLIQEELFLKSPFFHNPNFNILWSTTETYQAAKKILSASSIEGLIHITTKEESDDLVLNRLTDDIVNETLLALMKRTIDITESDELKKYLIGLLESKPVKRDEGNLPFLPLGHNCTTPSLTPLFLLGYGYEKSKKMVLQEGEKIYIDSIKETAELIFKIHNSIDVPIWQRKNDIIIYCPSMYGFLYNLKEKVWKDLFRKLNKEGRTFVRDAIIRNRGYSNITMKSDNVFNPYEDDIIGGMLLERQKELRLFTYVISILTSNQFVPAIRLRNSVILHHSKLNDIYNLIASSGSKAKEKLSKKVKIYNETILKSIGDDLKALVNNKQKLFAVCDFPIEWICFDSIPLMFTHEVSKISPTPGNLFMELASRGQRIHFDESLFKKVLVIRSFESKDPVGKVLTKAIEHYDSEGLLKNIEVKFVDVKSESQLITVLNEYTGMMVVFDCHGGHGGIKSHAWLKIGNEKVDVWFLANKCLMPPIVFLSACSTHPIDGSHASVANGLLRCGAVSIVGTYAPVQSAHSARLVARFLHRISAFLPIFVKERPFSWREFMTGLFRMSYISDVLNGLYMKDKLISKENHIKIHQVVNFLINEQNDEWFHLFKQFLQEVSGESQENIDRILYDKYMFVETMLYSQIGRPENIIITSNHAE